MPPNPVNSYVTRAEFADNKIVLTVQVDDFKAGESLEIYGEATQNTGAFAPFYGIQDVPPADSNGHSYLTVTADPVDAGKFKGEERITVFVRVAKVWVTVLSTDESVPKTTAWKPSEVATVEAYPPPAWPNAVGR